MEIVGTLDLPSTCDGKKTIYTVCMDGERYVDVMHCVDSGLLYVMQFPDSGSAYIVPLFSESSENEEGGDNDNSGDEVTCTLPSIADVTENEEGVDDNCFPTTELSDAEESAVVAFVRASIQ